MGLKRIERNQRNIRNELTQLDAITLLPSSDGRSPVTDMITGYVDEKENVFCTECWSKAKALGGAARMLDTIDPINPDDHTPFWVVDDCVMCGAHVKYKDIKLLA